jgi:hypothetical protein
MDLKSVAIGIAIIILTSFVIINGIGLIYPSVEYEDYCNIEKPAVYETEQLCVAEGGKWNPVSPYEKAPSQPLITGYCDTEFYCRQTYEDASQARSRYIFFIALPLGIIILILGAVFFGLESVGVGLMGGGIVTLIYGAGGYWRYAQQWLRFLLPLIGLIVLIYFAYWFNKRSNKSIRKKRR